ncbi:MAG TPA: transglutaminase domain-containing protein [Solirubrobacter sp.]|nr:transglutaminase domain-containing protein [Solirubrobacter sp.]
MARSLLTLAVAGVVLFASPPVSRAASSADAILRDLAANQTHSWIDDELALDEIVAKYEAGNRLYVTCGNVAEVGRRLLRAEGYTARVVQTITRHEFDYFNDGHLMLEVWLDNRWQLYDLDVNRRAVDAAGEGVSLVDQVAAAREGRALWQPIADDPLWNDNEPNQAALAIARELFTNPEVFDARLMGVALLPADPEGRIGYGTFFADSDQAERLADYPGGWSRFLATPAQWELLTTTTMPVALPVPQAVPSPPAPRVAPTVSPVPESSALAPVESVPAVPVSVTSPPRAAAPRRPPCKFGGKPVVRQGVTCEEARQVLLRFTRSGTAPRRWSCKGRNVVQCRRIGNTRVSVRVTRR